MQGRKTAKGSKNRIENRSHHHGRIEGIVAGLSRLMMGIPKNEKKGGACLPHSARSRAVLAGRFLILGAQFSVDVLYRGGKPQRGRRIALKIDHIITILLVFEIWRAS
jgi:hypothetical protein